MPLMNPIWNQRPAGHGQGQAQIAAQAETQLLTAGGGSYTPGAWVEVTASAPAGVTGFIVGATNGSNTSRCFDVGIGPASSEVMVAQCIGTDWNVSSHIHSMPWMIPVAIPEGARVVIRVAASSASTTVNASVHLFTGAVCPYTFQVAVNPRGHARGVILSSTAWFEYVASLDEDYKAFTVQFSADGGSQLNTNDLVSFGVGDAGNEVTLWSARTRNFVDGDTGPAPGAWQWPLLCRLHKGQRLAVKSSRGGVHVANLMLFR